jgi:hypothetical protein
VGKIPESQLKPQLKEKLCLSKNIIHSRFQRKRNASLNFTASSIGITCLQCSVSLLARVRSSVQCISRPEPVYQTEGKKLLKRNAKWFVHIFVDAR